MTHLDFHGASCLYLISFGQQLIFKVKKLYFCHLNTHKTMASTQTNNFNHNQTTLSQLNICICCFSSALHTWVLGTLCKAYLEHTLPGVERGRCAKSDCNCQLVKANTGCRLGCAEQISHLGRQRLQSARGPQINTHKHKHTHMHHNREGRDEPEPSGELFTAPDWAKSISKHPPLQQAWATAHKLLLLFSKQNEVIKLQSYTNNSTTEWQLRLKTWLHMIHMKKLTFWLSSES